MVLNMSNKSVADQLLESYVYIYQLLGRRQLDRAGLGYCLLGEYERRDLEGPKSRVISTRCKKLLRQLESAWMNNRHMLGNKLKLNYFCGILGLDTFLVAGAELILMNRMDYYTVDLWEELLSGQLVRPCCVLCRATEDLLSCSKCKQVMYCSIKCQAQHWKKTDRGHKYECKQMVKCERNMVEGKDASVAVDSENLRVILKTSLKLVEEAESQHYNDEKGQMWLVMEKYRIPIFATLDIKFEKFHPCLYPYMFQSAESFTPRKWPGEKFLMRWGLPPIWEAAIAKDEKTRADMTCKRMVADSKSKNETPEEQFVEKLMQRKLMDLSKARIDPNSSPDLVLKIELVGTDPLIWRRFQCPAAVPLFTLADKILAPVMGWARNYHAHTFVDRNDGAHFGPTKIMTVDMIHVKGHIHKMIDDRDVQLGQLLKSKGDTIGWVYDLGDWWEHQIVLEDVVKSSGVALLGGEMSCPAEDWEGNEVWQETVMKQLPYPVILEDIDILNYKETGQDKLRPMYGQAIFDASHFDLDHYKEQLKVSLGSNLRLQQPGVAKSFSGSTTGQPIEEIVRGSLAWCAGRECGGDGMMEVVNLKRDQKDLALCANCGLTRDLLMCRRCKQVYYCSVDCQQKHWRCQHMDECKKLKEIRKQFKKDDARLLKDETSARSDVPYHLLTDVCSKNCMPFYNMETPTISKLKEKFFKVGMYCVEEDWLELKLMYLSCEPLEELSKAKELSRKYLQERKL